MYKKKPFKLKVSFTPPNVPSSNEIVHQSFNEWVLARLIRYWLPVMKAIYWAISFTEIATIASCTTDSLSTTWAIAQHAVGQRIRDIPITFPFILGTALAVAGGLIRWWCFHTLGRYFTFQLSVRKGHHIVTTGPYAVIRHPSYTAAIVQIIGMLILHGSPTSWLRHSGVLNIPGLKLVAMVWLAQVTVIMISAIGRVSQEDEVLKSAFGDEWERWAKAVRYRLVPGVY
ncbi:hypothetical protein CY34DRAFT_809766 [Suillus luteus UH-Slu-Lm8-n1]|uniref:Protein-S-isoprenylcysteine O-methyltransferase n=1 Tax=Suillus luteus UH-Slu-Lm8-n1 TaxID=930992 RepID=A0A0D0A8N6_9AGAM|nr:hypothetical protein CY34DRAFT_809766 [Suillus luteus UH-Slu-Lm8-n1]